MTDDSLSEPVEEVRTQTFLARRAARALSLGLPIDPDGYRAIRTDGIRYLSRKLNFESVEAQDIVDESVAQFLRACASGSVRAPTSLAYYRKIVWNEGVDRLRRRREQPSQVEAIVDKDDAIARIIDQRASATIVERILADEATAGNVTATRVLNAFLTLAETMGATPSSREVAAQSGVSHVTVQVVLRALRRRLEEAQET